DRIVLKLLAKDPSRRYQNAASLIQDFERLEHAGTSKHASRSEDMITLPLDALRPSLRDRVRSRWRPLVFGSAGAILAVGAVLIAIRLAPSRRARYESVAVLPFRLVSADSVQSAYVAEGLNDALVTKLTQISKLRVSPWLTAQRFAQIDRPLTE